MSITDTSARPRTTAPNPDSYGRHAAVPAPRHQRRANGAATSLPGSRLRHDDPAMPRRSAAAAESTRALPAVQRRADGLARPARLPFPRTAGLLIRCPDTGALAVSCNRPSTGYPDAERFPCFAVIEGHAEHGGHLWLTYGEACRDGFELVGDVHTVTEGEPAPS